MTFVNSDLICTTKEKQGPESGGVRWSCTAVASKGMEQQGYVIRARTLTSNLPSVVNFLESCAKSSQVNTS